MTLRLHHSAIIHRHKNSLEAFGILWRGGRREAVFGKWRVAPPGMIEFFLPPFAAPPSPPSTFSSSQFILRGDVMQVTISLLLHNSNSETSHAKRPQMGMIECSLSLEELNEFISGTSVLFMIFLAARLSFIKKKPDKRKPTPPQRPFLGKNPGNPPKARDAPAATP